MRNLKRALSLALSAAMIVGMMVMGASAAGYQDVDASNDHQEAIEVLQAVGIMSGVDNEGNFNPDGSVTRNQMAVIMAHLLNLDYDYYRGTNPFTDVPEWAAPYVAACAAEGVVSGIGNGQYGGDNTVTAAQAALMIMKALGYFQYNEDFGSDWQVATVRQASYINLFDNINANAESALTRGQVAQLVLNGLLSDMVTFTGDVGTTATIGDSTIHIGYRAEYTSKTSSAAKYNTLVGGKTDIAQQGQYYIQLGEELYNGKLTMRADTDAFQRPATTWTYNSDTIGTYVNYDLMVEEYTTAVSGEEMYNVVGKTAFDKYDFSGYVNGEKSTLCDEISKNNDKDVSNTDNGALTQVFVNNDAEEVVVTVVNTYLAKATADYNDKKETATFEVYGLTGNKTVSAEDFDVTEVEAGDFVLVTYADKEIQSISDVEILSDVEISKFTTSGSVTVDGTEYDASAMQIYDATVLANYTAGNLKDTTYNVYLDQYGYAIGVDIVEGVDNYLFVTGVDAASSNLTNKTWEANAIFMDGTSAVIDVEDGDVAFASFGGESEVINSWFKYTVDNDGVYTLTKVQDSGAFNLNDDGDVAQKHDTTATKINDKNISLLGLSGRVYGNEDSVYLLADLDTVNTRTVIKGVDEVVTGVDNAAFTVTNTGDSRGVYTLYSDDAYVIAAVVVGESDTVSKNVAYVISDDISSESYSTTDKAWTWTRDVIINGEKVTLTETNSKDVSVLENYNEAASRWAVVKYDADGNVKDIEALADDYYTTIAAAVDAIEKDNDVVYVQIADELNHQYTLKGNTLYDDTDDELGFLVSTEVKIVLKQQVNNKMTTTYDEGVTTLKAILADLNEDAIQYEFNAVIEDGRATSVIIIDWGKDNDFEGPSGSEKGDWSIENPVTISPMAGVEYIQARLDEGKNVYINGDLTLDATLVIPAGTTLLVNGDLNGNGYKIANSGDLKVKGKINLDATQTTLDGNVTAYTVAINYNGKATITGTVTVKDDGTDTYGKLWAKKDLKVASGAAVYATEGQGLIDVDGDLENYGHVEFSKTLDVAGTIYDYSDNSIVGPTVKATAVVVDGGNMQVATLNADTVTVKDSGNLVVTAAVADKAGAGNATIVVEDATFDASEVDEDDMSATVTEDGTREVATQAELTAALADSKVETISLGEGEYTLSELSNVTRDVTFVGNGSTVIKGQVNIKGGEDAFTFKNITFKTETGYGILVNNNYTGDLTVDGCTFEGRYGIYADNNDRADVNSITVKYCTFKVTSCPFGWEDGVKAVVFTGNTVNVTGDQTANPRPYIEDNDNETKVTSDYPLKSEQTVKA